MNLKNGVIAAAALAVVGFALYLFIQVRATAAPARVTNVAQPAPAHPVEQAPPPPPTATAGSATTPPESVHTVERGPLPQPGREVDGPPPALPPPDPAEINVKLDSMMELANKAYDGQDFDQATAIAGKVLSKDPNNVRMLRILVSANCIQGDSALAQQYYEKLPVNDRSQMKARCDRYGVTFKDPPP